MDPHACVPSQAGRFPLHTAAAAGRSSTCALLLSGRGSPGGMLPATERAQLLAARDRAGCDPLLLAVLGGHLVRLIGMRCTHDSSLQVVSIHMQTYKGHVSCLKLCAADHVSTK